MSAALKFIRYEFAAYAAFGHCALFAYALSAGECARSALASSFSSRHSASVPNVTHVSFSHALTKQQPSDGCCVVMVVDADAVKVVDVDVVEVVVDVVVVAAVGSSKAVIVVSKLEWP